MAGDDVPEWCRILADAVKKRDEEAIAAMPVPYRLAYEGMLIRKAQAKKQAKVKPSVSQPQAQNSKTKAREQIREGIIRDLNYTKNLPPMDDQEFLEYIGKPENIKKFSLIEKLALYLILTTGEVDEGTRGG